MFTLQSLPAADEGSAECVRFKRESFGALHQMMAGLSPDERDRAWADIGTALEQFQTADGFVGPCEMLVGAGTVPT